MSRKSQQKLNDTLSMKIGVAQWGSPSNSQAAKQHKENQSEALQYNSTHFLSSKRTDLTSQNKSQSHLSQSSRMMNHGGSSTAMMTSRQDLSKLNKYCKLDNNNFSSALQQKLRLTTTNLDGGPPSAHHTKLNKNAITEKNLKCLQSLENQMELYDWKEKYRVKCEELSTLTRQTQDRERWFEKKLIKIRLRETQMQQLTNQVEEKEKYFKTTQDSINDKYQELQRDKIQFLIQKDNLKQMEETTSNRDKDVESLFAQLNKKSQEVCALQTQMEQFERQLDDRQNLMEKFNQTIQCREQDIIHKEAVIGNRDQELLMQIQSLAQHEIALIQIEEKLSMKLSTLTNIQEKLFNKMLRIENCEDESLVSPPPSHIKDEQYIRNRLQSEVEAYMTDVAQIKPSGRGELQQNKSSFKLIQSPKNGSTALDSYLYK